MKKYKLLAILAILTFFFVAVGFGQTLATLTLPDTTAALGDTISVPLKVSTTSNIGLAQFVFEFDSTIIKFQNAVIGKDGAGFLLSQNQNLPFPVTSNETNENVLVQISGGGSGAFSGQDKEVVKLNFIVKDSPGKTSLIFDQTSNHTFLTTTSLNDITGTSIDFVDGSVDCLPTNIMEIKNKTMPGDFALSQNYPNPFNPETTIRFDIPGNNQSLLNVNLFIYNLQGQLVRNLLDEEKSPGVYSVQWNGLNDSGKKVSTGVYLYSITAGDFKTTKKMAILK